MAIYRIYPISDTTIYSETPLANTGLDEIVELSTYRDVSATSQISRILTKYDLQEINTVLSNNSISNPISASLNLFLADAYELPVDFEIQAFPIAELWDVGVGKYGDIPLNDTGASWTKRLLNRSGSWDITGSMTGVTSSYSNVSAGGGTWYYQVSGSNVGSTLRLTPKNSLDVKIDITNILAQHRSGSISNNGIILKFDNVTENKPFSNTRIKFFGIDTNTIYSPFVELKWNDFVYQTGSLNILNSSVSDIKITNNRGKYVRDEKVKFRLLCRPKYPQRTFTTSSVYLTNYALPTASYWALKDEHTNDTIVDFDKDYTKIGCDSTGPYFNLYMNTLQPERYYRLLIKTEVDGSSVIVDSNTNIFKVTRNV